MRLGRRASGRHPIGEPVVSGEDGSHLVAVERAPRRVTQLVIRQVAVAEPAARGQRVSASEKPERERRESSL